MKRWLLYTLLLAALFAAAWTYSAWSEPARRRQAMLDALYRMDRAEVHRLLDRGYGPTFFTESGESPLSLFTEAGDHEGMEKALRGGADPNTIGPKLTGILEQAINQFDFRAVEMLLEAGADPNANSGWGDPPLFGVFAGQRSETDQLKMLKLLVKHRADIDCIAKHDGTALLRAVVNDHPRIVAYLLSNGANPRLKPPNDRDDPLTVATGRGYGPPKTQIAQMLRAALARQAPLPKRLFTAVGKSDERELASCLNEGGDPDLRDSHRSPLLHLALGKGDLDTARVLLQFGANLEAEDAAGRRPLMIAANRQDTSAAKYLVALGADIAAIDSAGESALTYARPGSALAHFLPVAQQANDGDEEPEP